MQKNIVVIGLLIVCMFNPLEAKEDSLFPLTNLKPGIDVDEFLQYYPDAKPLTQGKRDENGKLIEAAYIFKFENHDLD